MKLAWNSKRSYFVVSLLAVLLLLCFVFALDVPWVTASALDQDARQRKYDFSIYTGEYISGIATDIYEIPVFTLKLTKAYTGAFAGDNKDIRFFYAFSNNIVNPLDSIPEENWIKLSSEGDVANEQEGVVQYDDVTGVATLDFSLEQVTDGNISNYVFHKFVYFKVANTAINESLDPEIVVYESYITTDWIEVIIDFTPDTIKDKYDFDLDTSGYMSGVTLYGSPTDFPAFILTLKRQENFYNTTITYALHDEYVANPKTSTELVWLSPTDPATGITADSTNLNWEISLLSQISSTTEDIFHKFMYFKVNSANSEEEYVSSYWIETIMDKSGTTTIYEIVKVSASYNDGSVDREYPITNAQSPLWVSSGIKIEVKTHGDMGEDAGVFYSLFGGEDQPLVYNSATKTYVGTILGSESKTLSYGGTISLKAMSSSGQVMRAYDGDLRIYVDRVEPVFAVEAHKSNNSEYLAGEWSSSNVKYTITPTSTNLKSGARYQYLDVSGWNDLTEAGSSGVFVYEVTESMVLSFRAVSGSGIIIAGDDYVAQIDKVTPALQLDAVDGNGREIITMGATEGPNQRAGYAQNQIIFTLRNTANQGDIRNPIYYEYKISPDPEAPYTQIPSSGSNYILQHSATANSPIVNRAYYIRIRTGAGLVSEKTFVVTVLRENFYVDMSIQPYYPAASLIPSDTKAWVNQKIKVDFRMPVFIDMAEEYEIYGYLTGDTTTGEKLPYVRSAIDEQGYAVYTAEVNRDVNGSTMSFYVLDKARNRVQNSNDGDLLRTPILNLDLKIPDAEIKATILGSSIELGPNDWSSGEVVITIEPEENISGTICYRMLTETQQSITAITKNSSGVFEIPVIETGIYRYVLKSGAGLVKYISIPVNIDTTPISFSGIEADLIDENGGTISNNIEILGANPIANNVKVRFITNHAGHFRYYYAPFISEASPVATGPYVLGEGEEFFIEMPIEGGKGEFKYIFYLESRVQSKTGQVQITSTHTVIFRYDVRNYSILVSGITGTDWVGEPIDFALSILDSTQYENDPIVISKYQYRLKSGPDANVWLDIDSAVDGAGSASFLFRGIKQYFNLSEQLDDQEIMANPDEYSIRKYSSYNGVITFRGINSAGHPSTPLDLQVKVDTSTPSIVYAVNQTKGEIVWDSSNNLYHIYSINQINLQNTNAISDPTSIFKQKAPISYYYMVTTQSDSSVPGVNVAGWTELLSAVQLSESYYWVYAKNPMMTNDSVSVYKVHVFRETTVLAAEIISGGTTGASGAYEFNWTDKATVRIRATSQTGLYFWYKIDEGEWVKYNGVALPYNRDGEIRFFGEADPLFPEAVIRNFKGTVKFKVTNLAGAEVILNRSVIVKIDVDTPRLGPDNINLSTTTTPSISIEDARDRWYSSAILVEITGNDNIPSGVIYQYKLDGTDDYQFMRTNKISTDDIIATHEGSTFLNGNGTITIVLQAKSMATQSYRTYTLTFNIDKIYPDFNLVGQAMSSGGIPKGRIVSGAWTNADEVVISREVVKKSASDVSYTYYDYNTPEMIIPWAEGSTLSFTLISKIIVVAENMSGLKVTKEFQVNIDSIKPVIHSGIIVNSNDPKVPNVYYIDQVITYTEENLDYAIYNNFPLSNGQIIATNTVDNSNGGYVHIVVADKAGNKAELKFYMTIFPLTVSGEDSSIELNDDHLSLLSTFENHFNEAKANNALDASRTEYFETSISRLRDRVVTLQKQIDEFRNYLVIINQRPTFELVSDYPDMKKYTDYFLSLDPLIRYPDWQQNKIREGIYNTYYEKLEAEFAKLNALIAQVTKIEKNIKSLPAINVVEKGDYERVIRVHASYLSLSTDQKAVFNPNLYKKIIELKKICEVYLLQDDSSGISISGKDLVGEDVSVSVEVITYDKTTEIFNEAQKVLMATLPESASRAIVSMNKVGLTGWGSQFETGAIVVTIPIPEEFYDYTNFAVYRQYSDGTLAPIDGVQINKDGKSVSFPATRLDTYVLATTANITVRESGDKVYGSILGIDVDREILLYLVYAGIAVFAIMLIIIVFMILKRRRFLRNYDRAHKDNLVRRGIDAIPKGNPPPASNPARPEERVPSHQDRIKYR